MWDTPFDESMLGLKQGVVIHCPDENLAEELFEIFKQNGVGVNWANEQWITHWGAYKNETAYFINGKEMLYGPKIHAENGINTQNTKNARFSALTHQILRQQAMLNSVVSLALEVANNVGHSI